MDSEKADKRRTGSYEVQYWKRTSGTPWTGRKMDRWVLAQINPKTSLEAKITKLPCDKNEPALIQAHREGGGIFGKDKEHRHVSPEQSEAAEDKILWTSLIHKIARSRSNPVAHNTRRHPCISKSSNLSFQTQSPSIKHCQVKISTTLHDPALSTNASF